MNTKISSLALALGLALSGAAAAATTMTSSEAEDLMMQAGMSEISPVDFRDDAWVATARNRDGNLVAVRVDPDTREVTWSRNSERTVTTTTTTTRRPVVVARAQGPVVVHEVIEQPVVIPAGQRLHKSDVRRVLAANGYHDIHDIDYKSRLGVWKAEARDASGDKLEIHVDPRDGRILHVEDD